MAHFRASVEKKQELFVFLLMPSLSMMSLASAIEPLRSLNRLIGREAYRWRLASLDGDRIAPSNGILLDTEPLDVALAGAERLFVCAGKSIDDIDAKPYLAALRKVARSGVSVGSVSTGTYVLARAGLLTGRRCTVHWESRPAFVEEFPEIQCTSRLYEIDGECLTCSGGTAAMDLMLHLIAETHGAKLADGVANQFHHERIRSVGEDQRSGTLGFIASLPASTQKAVALMKNNIERPLSMAELAGKSGLSPRQLERLILKHLGATPLELYMRFRVERARELLMYSNASVTDISVQVGFSSASHFATWYRRIFGTRPSEVRAGVLVGPSGSRATLS